VVRKRIRVLMWMSIVLLLASLALLSGCSVLGLQSEPLPTLFVIPTLTPSITPSVTLYLSPTPFVTQTPLPTATPAITATPLIAPTSTPFGAGATSTVVVPTVASNLDIQYFVPTPLTTSPGGTVTLAWASTGANQATVFRVNPDGSFGESWQVNPTGTLTVSAAGGGDDEKFVLRIGDGVNIKDAEAIISLTCNRSWFFTEVQPSSCPASAEVTTQAAEQEFERGWAYWMQTTDKVYILYEDGQAPAWEVYDETWSTTEPEDDPSLTPPGGLQQPVRGIGKVWRTNTTVKDRLGWAAESELGFTATFQQESGADPQNVFFSEPSNQLTRLESGGSSWRFGETLP